MVERIRQILQAQQLSPTQFADALGLARPIISHVLSGRNKPSLEVVQKIIAAFPDLSLAWLLSGQGPMLASAQPIATPTATIAAATAPERAKRPAPRMTASVPPVAAAQAAPPIVPVRKPMPVPEPAIPHTVVAAPSEETSPASTPVVTRTVSQNAPQVPASVASDPLLAFAEPGKTIRRIVIFYHDGTFSAYQPEVLS